MTTTSKRQPRRASYVLKEVGKEGRFGVRKSGVRAIFGKQEATFMLSKTLVAKLMKGESLSLVSNGQGTLVRFCEKTGRYYVGNGRTQVRVSVPKYMSSEVGKGLVVLD